MKKLDTRAWWRVVPSTPPIPVRDVRPRILVGLLTGEDVPVAEVDHGRVRSRDD